MHVATGPVGPKVELGYPRGWKFWRGVLSGARSYGMMDQTYGNGGGECETDTREPNLLRYGKRFFVGVVLGGCRGNTKEDECLVV